MSNFNITHEYKDGQCDCDKFFGTRLRFPLYTNAERDKIHDWSEGEIIYNVDLFAAQLSSGNSWYTLDRPNPQP